MAVTNPRNHTLLFRLTYDEYKQLLSAASGARSLSEFAREKLMGAIGRHNPIEARLTELHSTVSRLAELLAASLEKSDVR